MSSANSISSISPAFPHKFNLPIESLGESAKKCGSDQKGDSLENLTTEKIEVHTVEEKRVTTPLDLTRGELRSIGVNSNVAKLQSGVVRLRVEVNGQTLGCGSGIVISADGLILSVNHVPAIGQKASENPFDLLAGTQVLKNLKSWSQFTTGKGDVKLIADFVQNPPPETVFTPNLSGKDAFEHVKVSLSGKNNFATRYSREDDTIDIKSYPVRILAESPSHDLMLCKVDIPEVQDPFPFVKVTDTLLAPGDLVYSIGHPGGIKHNALALGEVLDPSFDVNKLKDAANAHALILNGIANVLGGKGLNAGNMPADLAKGLSVMFAGIDVESLISFMNGAVVSTNNIAPGSSGGLLTDKNGEAVGVTYLGALMQFNDTALVKYAAGVLGFNTSKLPLSHITGSVGMNKKAIPFLRDYGVDIQRIRDGEPSGIADIERRVAKRIAREAMVAHFRTSGIAEADIPGRLNELGLEEAAAQSPIQTSATTESSQYFVGIDDNKFSFPSKPIQINDLTMAVEDSNLQITLKIKCEGGEDVEAKVKIDPSNFDLNTFADSDTRSLVTTYFISNQDKLTELERLQKELSS